MQTFQQLFSKLLKNIRVELTDEFDRNFERKAFFNTQWKPANRNSIGSLMIRTGALRSSITSSINGTAITWKSTLPYANIHNEGGTITVTKKMKGFFWYRYRMITGGNSKNLNPDALFWKAMALKPIGSKIQIEKRQFIGDHPQVRQAIDQVTAEWLNGDVKQFIHNQLKNIVK